MVRLLILFIVVPAVELALLIEVGSRIGTPTTLLIIVITGVVGAFYARREGLGVLRKLQHQMGSGQLPADSMGDGALILVASALLMTPGFLTDAFGFLCLIPATRAMIRQMVWRELLRMLQSGRFHVDVRVGVGDEPVNTRAQVESDDVRSDSSKDVTDL